MLLCNRVDVDSRKLLEKKKSLELNSSQTTYRHNGSRDRHQADEVLELDQSGLAKNKLERNDQASKDYSTKQSASRSQSRQARLYMPSMSSLNLIFNKACLMSGEQVFVNRWLFVLRSIGKLMSASTVELVLFCSESRNLILEVVPDLDKYRLDLSDKSPTICFRHTAGLAQSVVGEPSQAC